jgi:hypothetical protein
MRSGVRIAATWKARRIHSLTLGRLPGREIEIVRLPICREKARAEQALADNRQIARRSPDETWRVEIRLGKKHLREVLTFAEFKNLGVRGVGLFRRATSSVRYLADGHIGPNISRHPSHPFWTSLERAVLGSLSADKWI